MSDKQSSIRELMFKRAREVANLVGLRELGVAKFMVTFDLNATDEAGLMVVSVSGVPIDCVADANTTGVQVHQPLRPEAEPDVIRKSHSTWLWWKRQAK